MHNVKIIAVLDRSTGTCTCGFSTKEQFGDRRTAKAKQALMLHLESAYSNPNEYQIKDGSALNCPKCKGNLDLKEKDKGLLLEDQPSVVHCKNGHEFDCYLKNGTLFLFFLEDSDGPFSTN